MIRLVRSELRKLTTTWLVGGYLLAAVLLNLLLVLPAILVSGSGQMPPGFDVGTAATQRQILSSAGGGTALLLGALLGTVAGAREFGHGTVARTFLASPRRLRALVAKLVLLVPLGALVGALLQGGGIGVVAIALPVVGESVQVGGDTIGRLLGAAAGGAAVGAVLGLGVGLIVRRTGTAVVGIVLLLFVVPPFLGQFVQQIAPWLPGNLVTGLAVPDVMPGVELPAVPAAIGALVAYGLVPLAASAADLVRRDLV